MNDYEIERIAAAINVLRPDWPTKSLMTLMRRPELANRARRDVAVALAWVACETNTAKPARVLEQGPWWRAAAIESPDRYNRRPPKRDEECPHHLGQYADNCGGCQVDARAADDEHTSPPRPREPVDPTAPAAAIRAALRGAMP